MAAGALCAVPHYVYTANLAALGAIFIDTALEWFLELIEIADVFAGHVCYSFASYCPVR